MSGVGSLGAVPSNQRAAKWHRIHPLASRRLVLAALTLVVTLALVVTSAPGLFVAFAPTPSVSREALFDALQSRFRDFSTFQRDIQRMEERIRLDGQYLATIDQLLGNPQDGMAPTLASFAAIETAADLQPGCRAADPWSVLVTTARRDIDTSADGSMRVALDMYFCVFDVPRYESNQVRYPVATVTLAASESRHTSALRSHIRATDRDEALQWLQAVIRGEVGHLHRLVSNRRDATGTLSDQINKSLQTNAATSDAGAVMPAIRALLLLAMLAIAATWVWLTWTDARSASEVKPTR